MYQIIYFLISSVYGSIFCDWIEITQIVRNHTVSESSYTTPKTYDVIMKSPISEKLSTHSSSPFITHPFNGTEKTLDKIESRTKTFDEVIQTSSTLRSSTKKNTSDSVDELNTDKISNKERNFTINKDHTTKDENGTFHKKEENKKEHGTASESNSVNDRIFKDNGVFVLLHKIQSNLLRYGRKTVSSKISVLTQLRDHLLYEIEKRMSNLWNDEKKAEAREYKSDNDDHQMDFPSNEGALMTIGFLTFAVFLVKLVLKLIHVIKYKKQYYYGATTSTTAASVFLRKRNISFDDLPYQSGKILRDLEEYAYNT